MSSVTDQVLFYENIFGGVLLTMWIQCRANMFTIKNLTIFRIKVLKLSTLIIARQTFIKVHNTAQKLNFHNSLN